MCGRTDEALAAAGKAAELRPNSPRFSSRLPWVLYRAKRYDEAIAAYLALLARFDGPPAVKMQELLRERAPRWPDGIGTSWRPTPWPPRPSTTSAGPTPATSSARPGVQLSDLYALKHRSPRPKSGSSRCWTNFPTTRAPPTIWATSGPIRACTSSAPENDPPRPGRGTRQRRLSRQPGLGLLSPGPLPGSRRRAGEGRGQGTGGDVLDHLGDAQLKLGQHGKGRRRLAVGRAFRKDKEEQKGQGNGQENRVEKSRARGRSPRLPGTRGAAPGKPPRRNRTHVRSFPLVHIKHKKAAVDAKRGKVWSKLAKAIIVAAKHGGGDADMNLRLRYAIDDAKAMGMPKDNIQRAIKRGTGELDGGNLDEVLYEGYGAGGVAILCEVLTDNRNRTAPEIRKVFELSNGKLGNTGCVAWMFETKGIFVIPAEAIDEEKLLEIALEAGADDVKREGDNFAVTCDQAIYREVGKALADAGLKPETAEITRLPKSTVDLDADNARKVLKLMERLDDHDDVQNVASNFNIPDEVMAEIGEE